MSMSNSIDDRIIKAAKIIGTTPEKIKSHIVSKDEIEDTELIITVIDTLTVDEVTHLFEPVHNSHGKCIAAAKILKAEAKEPQKEIKQESNLEQLLNSMKPIANWSDEELLTGYIESERDDLEFELQRRAKGRRFIVLLEEGTDLIDVKSTLMMLKKARKTDIPDMIKDADSNVTWVYRIEEIHPANRIRHECPIDPKYILFEDYCSHCEINFSGISLECRQKLRLISLNEKYDSVDMGNLIDCIRESGEGFVDTHYPRITKQFNELKMIGNLPSLIKYETPTTPSKAQDPFSIKEIAADMSRRGIRL
jgi:hypothetical protein